MDRKDTKFKSINFFIKRLIDLFGSSIGLILISPVLLISAILIKVTMPGPIFFKQQRIGKDKRLFYILKLRTMKVDNAAEAKHDTSKDSERKTLVGDILRRTKIDELPQLINVFVGDMSLVGPRPTFAEQAEVYSEYQMQRLKMNPGMTGLAQVNGNTALSWEERIKYDVMYVNNFSILLDIKILLKTIMVVVFGEKKFARKI